MNVFQKLVRLARVTQASADDKQFPQQQVEEHGKLSDVVTMFPYGITGNMSADTLVTLLALNGDESNSVAVGGYTKDRPRMAEGENCIFHPPTGTKIHFKSDGTLEINTKGKATNLKLTGSLKASGDIEAEGNLTVVTDAEITGKFGCNSAPPQPVALLGPAATDPATTITLVNAIRTALIANGIGTG